MMRHVKKTGTFKLLFLSAILTFSFYSCKDDEECNLPVITHITRYSTGETTTQLYPNTAYTIHGSQFDGVGSLLINGVKLDDWGINDTSLNFNTPVDMVTNDSTTSNSDELTLGKLCGSSDATVDIQLPLPRITRISNEFAIAGDEITVEGTYFVNLASYAFSPSEVGASINEFTQSSLNITVPANAGSAQELILYNTSGDPSSSATGILFHDESGIICNFDNEDTWDGTSGRVEVSSTSDFPEANGNIFVAKASGIGSGTSDIESMRLSVSFDKDFDYDGARPASYVGLKFEMYSQHDWQNAYYELEIGYRNTSDEIEFAYNAAFSPEDNETYVDEYIESWLTYTLPLNTFQLIGSPGIYAQSFGQLRVVNYMVLRFNNPSGGDTLSEAAIAMDNFRIVEIGAN